MGKLFTKNLADGTVNVIHARSDNKQSVVLSVKKDGDYVPEVNIDQKHLVVSVKSRLGKYDVYTFPKTSAGFLQTLLSRMVSGISGYFITPEGLMIFWKEETGGLLDVYIVSLLDYQQVLRSENEAYLYNVASIKLCTVKDEPNVIIAKIRVADRYFDNFKLKIDSNVFLVQNIKHRLSPNVSLFKPVRDTNWNERLVVLPVTDVEGITQRYLQIKCPEDNLLLVFGLEGQESGLLGNIIEAKPYSVDNVQCGALIKDCENMSYWIDHSSYFYSSDIAGHDILPFYSLERVEDYMYDSHAAFIAKDKDGMAMGIRVVNIKDEHFFEAGDVIYDVVLENACKSISPISSMWSSGRNGHLKYNDVWNVDGQKLVCECGAGFDRRIYFI